MIFLQFESLTPSEDREDNLTKLIGLYLLFLESYFVSYLVPFLHLCIYSLVFSINRRLLVMLFKSFSHSLFSLYLSPFLFLSLLSIFSYSHPSPFFFTVT